MKVEEEDGLEVFRMAKSTFVIGALLFVNTIIHKCNHGFSCKSF